MSRGGYWSDRADAALEAALRELPEGYTPAQLAKAIREAYPFGDRDHWPYKVWCKRVRAWVAALDKGLPKPRQPGQGREERPTAAGGTLNLFD